MDFRGFPGCESLNWRTTTGYPGNSGCRQRFTGQHANKYEKCLRSVKTEHGEKPAFLFAMRRTSWIAERRRPSMTGNGLSQQCICSGLHTSKSPSGRTEQRNIPSLFTGSNSMKHVKDIVAHLKLFFNPRDELAWSRVLLLIDGIG